MEARTDQRSLVSVKNRGTTAKKKSNRDNTRASNDMRRQAVTTRVGRCEEGAKSPTVSCSKEGGKRVTRKMN